VGEEQPVTTVAELTWPMVAVGVAAVLVAVGVLWLVSRELGRQFINSREKRADGSLAGRRSINVTFARVISLLAVAAFGVIGLTLDLVLDAEGITAYFTLLGIIAGYLVGAKTGTESSTEQTATEGEPTETITTNSPTLG